MPEFGRTFAANFKPDAKDLFRNCATTTGIATLDVIICAGNNC